MLQLPLGVSHESLIATVAPSEPVPAGRPLLRSFSWLYPPLGGLYAQCCCNVTLPCMVVMLPATLTTFAPVGAAVRASSIPAARGRCRFLYPVPVTVAGKVLFLQLSFGLPAPQRLSPRLSRAL